jgi:hypothetical protein
MDENEEKKRKEKEETTSAESIVCAYLFGRYLVSSCIYPFPA